MNISCGLIFRGFYALEIEFVQLNLLHLRPGCHYTSDGCHGMPKTSHDGFAYSYSSCPPFWQFDWLIIEQDSPILPDGFSCWTKLKTHVDQNCFKILGKLRKVMKLGRMLLIKRLSDYFSEKFSVSFRTIFEKFGNQQKILGKWFWSNFVKNIFFGKLSVNVRNIYVFAM